MGKLRLATAVQELSIYNIRVPWKTIIHIVQAGFLRPIQDCPSNYHKSPPTPNPAKPKKTHITYQIKSNQVGWQPDDSQPLADHV
jgi:hypothetical protein